MSLSPRWTRFLRQVQGLWALGSVLPKLPQGETGQVQSLLLGGALRARKVVAQRLERAVPVLEPGEEQVFELLRCRRAGLLLLAWVQKKRIFS